MLARHLPDAPVRFGEDGTNYNVIILIGPIISVTLGVVPPTLNLRSNQPR